MSDRHHIYLVPGFFGFANLGELKYFGHVRNFLLARGRAVGTGVHVDVVRTHPTASLSRRAVRLLETIASTVRRREAVHLIGHSCGGLDARLLLAPGAALPTEIAPAPLLERVRTVVSVATPHHGTPVAAFFTGFLGRELLEVLSLSTMYLLRFGHLPLRAVLQMGGVFARLDNLALNSAVLDEVFGLLLADFSVGRRRAVHRLFAEVAQDQALLLQLTAAAMDVFNVAVRDRQGVRYGSVVARAERPSVRSTLATGLDPSGQAIHAVYRALYRLAAQTPRAAAAQPAPHQSRVLRRAYGALPSVQANDGVVPTRSQLWGDVIHAARGDHLDVIGHFNDPVQQPPHFDWLASGSGFTRDKFEALWSDVVDYLLERQPRSAP
jgi:triacylglycerol esterase/lipase EstA (alpha/beta hydrolase family)